MWVITENNTLINLKEWGFEGIKIEKKKGKWRITTGGANEHVIVSSSDEKLIKDCLNGFKDVLNDE